MNFNFFDSIKLEEMDAVSLMNRTDTKYWFHIELLPELLLAVKDRYFILNVSGQTKLPYATTYYDTSKNRMFAEHHNGKLNRYKVRRRTYVASKISFLEVKFKSNKGRTIKKRVAADFGQKAFTEEERVFINQLVPFNCNNLQLSLKNEFTRLTLVSKNFNERCTIDLNLQFQKAEKRIALDDLVIVEIKSEGSPSGSPLARSLRDRRIRKSGFSKYCVGRTLTDSELKRNAFKNKIRKIEKTIQSKNNLYIKNQKL